MPVQQWSQTAELAVADPAHHDREVGVAPRQRRELGPLDLRAVNHHREAVRLEQLPRRVQGVQGEVVRAGVEGDCTGVLSGLHLGTHPGHGGAHIGGQRPAQSPVSPAGERGGELVVAPFAVVQE